MNGVTFGSYHSYDDLHLILESKEIGSASIKTNYVEVEGAHGRLDYTEYFGEPKYSGRMLVFNFQTIVPQSQFLELYSEIQDALHGQRMQIVLDADDDFYYIGRLSLSAFTNEKNIGIISIECDCDPWKYKKNVTVLSRAVNGSASIVLANSRKRVVPSITTTAAMSVTFGGVTTSLGTGTFTIPTLELVEGNNTVSVSGTGNITFRYQEGGL